MSERAPVISLEEYRRINDINSMGTFLGCKHAIPAMRQAGGGSIVNISSVLGLRGASYAMAYCASKGAVRSLTKNVAMHCATMNIRCNSVHPGYIDTPMIAPRLSGTIDNMTGKQWLEQLHPLGRLGRADETRLRGRNRWRRVAPSAVVGFHGLNLQAAARDRQGPRSHLLRLDVRFQLKAFFEQRAQHRS